MEDLLRVPQKGDPLVPDPAPLERFGGPPADAYAVGYRLAAEILADHVRGRGEETFLFYPIVFLYRHHVELMLKNLILAFDEPGVRAVTGAEAFRDEDRNSLQSGKKAHSLQALWDHLRPSVEGLGSQVSAELIEGINYYIQQLNEIDPHSVSFRYPAGVAGTKEALGRGQKKGEAANLQTFVEAMDRLGGILGGIDTYVSEIIGNYYEMCADAQDSYY